MQKIIEIIFFTLLVSVGGSSSCCSSINGSLSSDSSSNNMSSENFSTMSCLSRGSLYSGNVDIKSNNNDSNDKINTESEVLIRFYERALEGKAQLKDVLMVHMKSNSDEKIISALYYTYRERYMQAYLAIIESIKSRLQLVIDVIEESDSYPEEFIEDLKRFCTEFDSDDDYVFITHSDANTMRRPFLEVSEFMHLDPHLRFPAAVRKILDIPVADSQIDSSFIRNNILANNFDLWTILVLHEIEMMDGFHLHDSKGVIESHLKWVISFETNEEMAKIAHQMYINSYFEAVKFIIDKKFSYDSPLKDPFWFQDLYSLFKYAHENHFPADFQLKVMKLARSCAMRHYVSKMGFTAANF